MVLPHVVQRPDRAVLVDDDQAVVALAAVLGHDLAEDLAVGAIHRLHRRLVAHPRDLHLVEAHRLDDAGVVGGEERVDLQAGRLLQVLQQRLPGALQVARPTRSR